MHYLRDAGRIKVDEQQLITLEDPLQQEEGQEQVICYSLQSMKTKQKEPEPQAAPLPHSGIQSEAQPFWGSGSPQAGLQCASAPIYPCR